MLSDTQHNLCGYDMAGYLDTTKTGLLYVGIIFPIKTPDLHHRALEKTMPGCQKEWLHQASQTVEDLCHDLDFAYLIFTRQNES